MGLKRVNLSYRKITKYINVENIIIEKWDHNNLVKNSQKSAKKIEKKRFHERNDKKKLMKNVAIASIINEKCNLSVKTGALLTGNQNFSEKMTKNMGSSQKRPSHKRPKKPVKSAQCISIGYRIMVEVMVVILGRL